MEENIMKNILLTTTLVLFPFLLTAQVNISFSILDKEQVMKRLFDNAEFNFNDEILWRPNYSEAINNQVSDDNYCHTKMDTIMYYHANDYDNAVVIFTTYKYENGEKQSCHVCAPTLGIATFARRLDTNWELKQFQKSFMVSGSYGARNKLSLTKIGKETYSLTCSGGYGNGGYFESSITYYSLKEFDKFNEIFSFQDYYSNEGAKENGYNSTTTIRFLQNKETNYTIELTTKFSNNSKIDKRIYNYSFDNNRYIFIRKVNDKRNK
ncbi:MAG: hypothetical protein ACOYMA_20700 [Bacteroidia bacterium]